VERAQDVKCALIAASVARHARHALRTALCCALILLILHIVLAHIQATHHLQHVRCRHCSTFSHRLLLPQLKQLILIIDHLHLSLLLHGHKVIGLTLQNRKLLLQLVHFADFLFILLFLLDEFLLLIIFFDAAFAKLFNLHFK
jgi:hypothetical protein